MDEVIGGDSVKDNEKFINYWKEKSGSSTGGQGQGGPVRVRRKHGDVN